MRRPILSKRLVFVNGSSQKLAVNLLVGFEVYIFFHVLACFLFGWRQQLDGLKEQESQPRLKHTEEFEHFSIQSRGRIGSWSGVITQAGPIP